MNNIIKPQGTPSVVSTSDRICVDCADANHLLALIAHRNGYKNDHDKFSRRLENAEAFQCHWQFYSTLFKMVYHVW